MKMKLIVAALAGAFAFGTAYAASNMSTAEYKSQMERLEANYKAAKERCKGLVGNAKDICQAEVKGEHEVAEAELKASYKGTEKEKYDARVAKARAQYNVAKEKCDDQKGNDKDVCNKEAKASYAKAKADAKLVKEVKQAVTDPTAKGQEKAPEKVADAKRDAIDTKRDAEYKLAKEKCDALTGQPKDNCVAEAKLKYGK